MATTELHRKRSFPPWPGEIKADRMAGPRWSLHNPPFGCRVALVAAVYAVVGAFAGEMMLLFIPVSSNPLAGFSVGAVIGAFVGGGLEAFFGSGPHAHTGRRSYGRLAHPGR